MELSNSYNSRNEIMSLCKSLHLHSNEEKWMTSLQAIEVKKGLTNLQSLMLLKSLIPSITSTQSLTNLVHLFVRKVSQMVDNCDISKDENIAKQTLNTVKDFWALVTNQHVVLTQEVFGKYSPHLYEVLCSLASLYVDLFIAVHSAKSTKHKASQRLCSWLMFELNDRCIKAALLECKCTKSGATILLPLLRKLLSKPLDVTCSLDYLLHCILLKRWAFVCEELSDIIQTSLSIRAPEDFMGWLNQHWSGASEYLPSDKSLKGRRVSEVLLELDQTAVEQLIDVFSHCLWAAKPESATGLKQKNCITERNEQAVTSELFVIDKQGSEQHPDDQHSLKKKRKFFQEENNVQNVRLFSDNNSHLDNDKDILTVIDSSDQEIDLSQDMECDENVTIRESQTESDIDMVVESATYEPEIIVIDGTGVQDSDEINENIIEENTSLKQGKQISASLMPHKRSDSFSEKRDTEDLYQEYSGSQDEFLTNLCHNSSSEELQIVSSSDDESDIIPLQSGIEDNSSPVKNSKFQSGIEDKSSPVKNRKFQLCIEDNSSPVKNSKLQSGIEDNSSPVKNSKFQSGIEDKSSPVKNSKFQSGIEDNSSPVKNSKFKSPKLETHMKLRSFTEIKSKQKKRSRTISDSEINKHCSYKNEMVPADSNRVNIGFQSTTEFQVASKLSEIRVAMSCGKRASETNENVFRVKTRIRTKSESQTQKVDHSPLKQKKYSQSLNSSGEESNIKEWLRKFPSRILKDQHSVQSISVEDDEKEIGISEHSETLLTESPVRRAHNKANKTRRSPGTKDQMMDDIFGKALKTYSRKDKQNKRVSKTEDVETFESQQKTPAEELGQNRYFLRTNCSHRLQNSETACPTCSTEKVP